MSGSLAHSPAEVIRQYLIDQAIGTLPTDSGSWPVQVGALPETPDNVIALYNTSPIKEGRTHTDGQSQYQFGIQALIRAHHFSPGRTKAQSILDSFDNVLRTSVTIGSSSYLVQSVDIRSGIIDLGPEADSARQRFSINVTADIYQTA